MTILEKRKLAPERDEHLKKGEFTVLNGEYSKNFNVYVVGTKHKEAVDFIKVALDRSTDKCLTGIFTRSDITFSSILNFWFSALWFQMKISI